MARTKVVDLAAQLIALPFALLSRLVRLTSWPVRHLLIRHGSRLHSPRSPARTARFVP